MDLVKNVFDLRRKFLVIGLTGRTGSGCTTVAKLLKDNFAFLFQPQPHVKHEGVTNDERKYRIEHTFLKTIWEAQNFTFQVITASDIIFYYVLKDGEETLKETLGRSPSKIEIDTSTQTGGTEVNSKSEELVEELFGKNPDLKRQFQEMSSRIREIDSDIAEEEFLRIQEKDDEAFQKASDIWKYLNDDLPKFRKVFMENVIALKPELRTSQFQYWGNNIRKYGLTKVGKESSNPSELASTIRKIIEMRRRMMDVSKQPTYIIIDSIRNPYEVHYFRELYSSFFLMSISTDAECRRHNLVNANYRLSEIGDLDEVEYPSRRKDISDSYNTQDVQKCVELSDIHIFHHNNSIESNIDLKRQLLHFISLMLHPGLVQPTHEERLMQIANTAKLNSGCISRQVGAVVTDKNYSVKAIGWNTVAKGQTPCSLRTLDNLVSRNDLTAYSTFEKADSALYGLLEVAYNRYKKEMGNLGGVPLAYCFKDFYTTLKNEKNQVYTRSLHAEENAFLQLAKYGSAGIEGGFLFTTASPCELCAKKAYQLGIAKIVYIDIYPGISFSHILKTGSNNIEIVPFTGAIGRAYDALYNPFFALKDEIEYVTGVKVSKLKEKEEEKETKETKETKEKR